MRLKDENAEVCVHCGGAAFARIAEDLPLVHGWYGSAVVDMNHQAVVDRSLASGPVCDDYLKELIAARRIIPVDPVASLQDVTATEIEALLELGIALTEREIDDPGENPGLPVPPVYWESSEPLASGLIDGVFGRTRGVDIVGVGRLMALIGRARGHPLVDERRKEAIASYVTRILEAQDLSRDMTASVLDR